MTRLPPAALIAITTFGLTTGALAMGTITGDALKIGTNTVFASESADAETNPTQTLVKKIAAKFSLQEAAVQAVFDEDRTQRQSEMHAKMTTALADRLQTAVHDGTITNEQKTLILAKLDQLQKQRETDRSTWQNKTPQERRTAMLELRTELESWAKENNIAVSSIMGEGRGMMDGSEGMGWGGHRGYLGEAPLSN